VGDAVGVGGTTAGVSVGAGVGVGVPVGVASALRREEEMVNVHVALHGP